MFSIDVIKLILPTPTKYISFKNRPYPEITLLILGSSLVIQCWSVGFWFVASVDFAFLAFEDTITNENVVDWE